MYTTGSHLERPLDSAIGLVVVWKIDIQGFSTSLNTSQTVHKKYFSERDNKNLVFNYGTQFSILHEPEEPNMVRSMYSDPK